MKTLQIGPHKIGEGFPTYVIAEIGHNHQGNLDMALGMIEAAAACGVQAVKFQKRDIESLYTSHFSNQVYDSKNSYGKTYGQHREYLELNKEEFILCKEKAIACGVDFLVTPFDEVSALFCNELGVNAFKLASGDLTNEALIRYVAAFKKPMILSTGASALLEIEQTYQLLTFLQAHFSFLYAVSSYPTSNAQLNLQRIQTLQQRFNDIPVGFSGHDEGIDGALYAAALGARVIEKHFTLDKTLKGTDQCFSLEPTEMKLLVEKLQALNTMLGNTYEDKSSINSFEWDARMKMGKGIYAATTIKAGTILTPELFSFKSPGTAMTPYDIKKIIGRKILSDLNPDEALQWEMMDVDVKEKVGL
ncbi:MAG: N-acetylneuraminate synthase [Cytophagaceae bacterium]|jgi:sialic acid synthase SpsE|nr:N-acetylneuraminate synthase [Cytophagaceae bacterium]